MRKYETHKNCVEGGVWKVEEGTGVRQGSSSFSACRSPAYFIIIILQGIISFEWSSRIFGRLTLQPLPPPSVCISPAVRCVMCA